jgi:diguanylate cyclase (GGDEF)-like protein/PAS domain S-box-containing protein
MRVLLVEDDPVYAAVLRSTLAFAGGGPWVVESVESFASARERLVRGGIDAVLLDLRLPDVTGIDAVSRVCGEFPTVPVLVLTALDDESLALDAVKRGAQDYLVKGQVEEHLLPRSIRYAIERKRTTDAVRQLDKAVSTMQLGVTVTDLQGRIVYVNAAEAEMHGYAADDMLGQDARRLSPPEDWRPLTAERLGHMRKWKRERVRIRKDGTTFPVQLMSDVVTDAGGQPIGIVTTCEDISDRKRAEAELRSSEERYALAARGTNDGLWDWNLATDRVYYSERWKAMLGYAHEEVADRPAEWLERVHPDDAPRLQAKMTAHLDGSAPHFEDEHRMRHKDGSYRWFLSRGFAVRDGTGRPYRMAGAQTDVTDRRSYDPLTGLPNRALFAERLGYAFARFKRRDDYPFAVVFVDLDRFKETNDTLGHLVGDQALIAVAKRLETCLRPGDTVGRFAGDEFAVLLERVRDRADALGVADRIQADLAGQLRLRGHDLRLTASMGVAFMSPAYERPEDLLRDADLAMYRAKAAGRGRYEVFDDSMGQGSRARQDLAPGLARALERGEIRLVYQPIVDLARGELTGFEGLVRWHDGGRVILPAEFLPAAIECGQVLSLGSWVLREGCRQLAAWRKQSAEAARLRLSLNLSPAECAKAGLMEDVEAALVAAGLAADDLILDLSEAVLQGNRPWLTGVLADLRSLGVRLHLDDFGQGPASLSSLHRFALDAVKLDPSLLFGDERERPVSALARGIAALAHRLGLAVVAEGVETEEQRDALREAGCAFGQGHYFSPPLDADAAAAYLASARIMERSSP